MRARAPEVPADRPSAPEPYAAAERLPAHLEALNVEHYAALCAELRLNPEWSEQILARYRVAGAAERAVLERVWSARMAANPALAETWRWHFARYEQWARSRPR